VLRASPLLEPRSFTIAGARRPPAGRSAIALLQIAELPEQCVELFGVHGLAHEVQQPLGFLLADPVFARQPLNDPIVASVPARDAIPGSEVAVPAVAQVADTGDAQNSLGIVSHGLADGDHQHHRQHRCKQHRLPQLGPPRCSLAISRDLSRIARVR
jgi:hypothetical protein